MKLSENPFAILNASPKDDRHRLTEKADEAALIGGAEVDDALASLMQMNKRITAELNWFPGADPDTAAAFTAYAEAAAAGRPAKLPPTDGLGSPLAQANALAAFFEAWPDSETDYSIGLCRSMDMILSAVTMEDTLEQINADRREGGWEPIPDTMALAEPLETRLRELSRTARARAEKIKGDEELKKFVASVLTYDGFDPHGAVGQAITDAYMTSIHDREERIRNSVTEQVEKLKGGTPTKMELQQLKTSVGAWSSLTSPVRRYDPRMTRTGQNLCHGMRETIVQFVNKAPTQPKQLSKTIPTFNGTRTLTLTYQSRKESALLAIELSGWLINQFPELPEQVSQLKKDKDTLSDIIVREEADAQSALIKAR